MQRIPVLFIQCLLCITSPKHLSEFDANDCVVHFGPTDDTQKLVELCQFVYRPACRSFSFISSTTSSDVSINRLTALGGDISISCSYSNNSVLESFSINTSCSSIPVDVKFFNFCLFNIDDGIVHSNGCCVYWTSVVEYCVVLLNHSYFWKRTSFKDESRCSYFSTIDISVVIERDDSTTELFERTELLYWVIVEVEVQIKDFSNRFSNPAMISCSLSADSFLWISAYAANASWILVSICSLVIPVAKNLYKKKGAAEQITVRTFFFFLMTNYGLPYP